MEKYKAKLGHVTLKIRDSEIFINDTKVVYPQDVGDRVQLVL